MRVNFHLDYKYTRKSLDISEKDRLKNFLYKILNRRYSERNICLYEKLHSEGKIEYIPEHYLMVKKKACRCFDNLLCIGATSMLDNMPEVDSFELLF